jgi:septal ring factor EnvC (AmiA/AmiB activator)
VEEGVNQIIASVTASVAGIGSYVLAQETPGGTDVQTLLTQFGVFGVVIVVFKYMLARQDQRDDQADKNDEQTLKSLRDDINQLRTDLGDERHSHDETRRRLYDALMLTTTDENMTAATIAKIKEALTKEIR